MEKWEKELKDTLGRWRTPRRKQEKVLRKSKESISVKIALLLLVVIVLASVVAWEAYRKSTSAHVRQPSVSQSEIIEPIPNDEISEMQRQLDELTARTNEMDIRSKKNHTKCQVLGIIFNENTVILKNGYNRQDLILLSHIGR